MIGLAIFEGDVIFFTHLILTILYFIFLDFFPFLNFIGIFVGKCCVIYARACCRSIVVVSVFFRSGGRQDVSRILTIIISFSF
jgi:hypothetical protein